MAIVVEDGTGKSDANSYIDVADADTYFLLRGNATWAAAADADKEAALVIAAKYIDSAYRKRWQGARQFFVQAMSWPRFAVIDEDGYAVLPSSVPQRIKDAQCAAAIRQLSGTDLMPDLERGGSVASITVGPISQTFSSNASPYTTFVEIDLIIGILAGGSSTSLKISRG